MENIFSQPRRRIIDYVANGTKTIYFDQHSRTYWRTLKAAKQLGPVKQQIKRPRYVRKDLG